jgi:ProP effector
MVQNERAARIFAVIELLAERWLAAFVVFEQRRRPLKLGIHNDILAVLDGAIFKKDLKLALGYYTSNSAYLVASQEGAVRVDLDGATAGVVSAEDAKRAAERLAVFHKFRRQKKAGKLAAPAPEIASSTQVSKPAPGRLSLGDLKEAALRRRQGEAVAG